MTAATNAPAELESVLDRQASLLAEIESTDRRRRGAIAACDPDALRDALDHRERALSELARLAPDLERLRAERGEDPTVRRRLADADAAFERIAQRDAEDLAELLRRRSHMADELASLSRARSAAGAYAPAPTDAPVYQDRRA